MNSCANCGTIGITKAHVKDKSRCLEEGISDHEYQNIVPLCYNCHYLLFDKRKMGIIKKNETYYFIYIDEHGNIRENESQSNLNIRQDNINWKNKRTLPKLWKILFKK